MGVVDRKAGRERRERNGYHGLRHRTVWSISCRLRKVKSNGAAGCSAWTLGVSAFELAAARCGRGRGVRGSGTTLCTMRAALARVAGKAGPMPAPRAASGRGSALGRQLPHLGLDYSEQRGHDGAAVGDGASRKGSSPYSSSPLGWDVPSLQTTGGSRVVERSRRRVAEPSSKRPVTVLVGFSIPTAPSARASTGGTRPQLTQHSSRVAPVELGEEERGVADAGVEGKKSRSVYSLRGAACRIGHERRRRNVLAGDVGEQERDAPPPTSTMLW